MDERGSYGVGIGVREGEERSKLGEGRFWGTEKRSIATQSEKKMR